MGLSSRNAAKDHASRSKLVRWLLLRPEEAAAKAAAGAVQGSAAQSQALLAAAHSGALGGVRAPAAVAGAILSSTSAMSLPPDRAASAAASDSVVGKLSRAFAAALEALPRTEGGRLLR